MSRRQYLVPVGLAAVLTLANAVKPAVVDDTAYVTFAGQIAAHPLDPYGGTLFWYAEPQPANEILLPPVLPYWLALGQTLFGDQLFALKLWMFPFALMFAVSLDALLRRFADAVRVPVLVAVVLGPAVLPMVNVMLDVPATALGLAAVAMFARGDRTGYGRAVLAGVLAGLAAQTKYTMLTVPAVLVWFGLLHGRWRQALVGFAVMAMVFVGWEAVVRAEYGVSHFEYHLNEQRETTDYFVRQTYPEPTTADYVRYRIAEKWRLFAPMIGYLGWLGVGVAGFAALALRVPRAVVLAGAVVAVAGFVAVGFIPASEGVLVGPRGDPKLGLATAVFNTLGAAVGFLVLANVGRLLLGRRPDAAAWFLAGWLAIELAGYFALTPFPGGRRVISLVVVGSLVVARSLALRLADAPHLRPAVGGCAAFAVIAGAMLFDVDYRDSLPERHGAAWAADRVGDPGPATVWYNGHWGFQYYCERNGMRPVVPDVSELRAGDWLVYPLLPDDYGFYRPYHGGAGFALDPGATTQVDEWVSRDGYVGQTIPTLYGGEVPMSGRDHPGLRLGLFRVTRDWTPRRVWE